MRKTTRQALSPPAMAPFSLLPPELVLIGAPERLAGII
jgi:hypothetical protein